MPDSSASDHDLISGCLEGRKGSWADFVDRFSKLIYWSIHKTLEGGSFCARKDICEDIFQEVFKRLLEKEELARLRDIQRVRKFLSVMACHATLDTIKSLKRHEKKTVPIELETFEEKGGVPADFAVSKEKNEIIAGILNALPLKERACIELHYLDGRTHSEVGRILGMSQDTVSTVIRRTKEKLKTRFGEKGLK